MESGDRPPRWEEVRPAEIAAEEVTSFADAAQRKAISLVQTDEGAPLLTADRDRLRRILENLVDNALKCTPEGGRVEVAIGPAPGGGARFEVRDNGPGIAAAHLPRLFERFYRVDKARSREMGGTGLGLAIVKHLCEGMGATISVSITTWLSHDRNNHRFVRKTYHKTFADNLPDHYRGNLTKTPSLTTGNRMDFT